MEADAGWVLRKHLAVERVLRQRFRAEGHWAGAGRGQRLGVRDGKVKTRAELYKLYKLPNDRDFSRDYTEGSMSFGSSPPEGLVYFPGVLAYYLKHRSADRLLAPPKDDEPLGKLLARVKRAGERRP